MRSCYLLRYVWRSTDACNYSEKLQRRGITPRDYIRENKLQVKRLQARNREQRALEAAPRPEPFKLSRFKTVRPRTTNQEVRGYCKHCEDVLALTAYCGLSTHAIAEASTGP